MITLFWLVLGIALWLVLAFHRCRCSWFAAATAAVLLGWTVTTPTGWMVVLPVWIVCGAAFLALQTADIRKRWLINPTLQWFRKTLPELSRNERIAMDSGTTGWESELFSGTPDWQQLERLPRTKLNAAEQAFIDDPLAVLLAHMADTHRAHTESRPVALDEQAWLQLKAAGFFGLVIPSVYGGLGFSAHARSHILALVGSAPGGATLGPIIATPNALGPAQLLLACGSEEQKQRYLPRLASGDDIPCFAVTSERAGTDAAAIVDRGVICHDPHADATRLGIKLNWHKRHITLAPVATLIGLAVDIHDPEQLLGKSRHRGITCVLVEADAPGVDNSRHHQPMGAAFPYGETIGRDVFVPLDAVIGGTGMIGQGWRVLMQNLPSSRALSTPSAAAGLCNAHARLAGAYARVRSQFNRPIGAFEGVEQLLARIGGHAYACEALRRHVSNAVDTGGQPAIAAAIAKYHCTSRAQQVVVDSMTLHAGKAVCIGPRNPISDDYAAAPLAATSDGTNLFTRSVLIFGQSSIRCHPFLQAEMKAAARPDAERRLDAFDAVFPAHIGHLLCVATRSLVLGLGDGRRAPVRRAPATRRYRRRINRYAASLALLTDLAMAQFGRNLRHRENISGRLGDVLSELYIASAVVRRYQDDGAHETDLNLVEWVCEDCFATIEHQLSRVLQHLPRRSARWAAKRLIFPIGRHADGPSDDCCHRVATLLQAPGETRTRVTSPCYSQPDAADGIALFDAAIEATVDTVGLRKRLRRAIKRGDLQGSRPVDCIDQAHETGLLDTTEYNELRQAYALHDAVIQVDTFPG